MKIIDPHVHMLNRTTDEYSLMAETGYVAVVEPAFWPGTDRMYAESHLDYFNHLTTFEPQRTAKRGIRHYCALAVNPILLPMRRGLRPKSQTRPFMPPAVTAR